MSVSLPEKSFADYVSGLFIGSVCRKNCSHFPAAFSDSCNVLVHFFVSVNNNNKYVNKYLTCQLCIFLNDYCCRTENIEIQKHRRFLGLSFTLQVNNVIPSVIRSE